MPRMTTLQLPARPPFNFHSVVESHGWVQLAPFRFDADTDALFYTDQLANGRVVEYRVSESPGGVRVDVPGTLGAAERHEVSGKVAWMFALDQDFSSFYVAARGEPKLRKARRNARGRVLRSPTFFEDVLKTILTTNTLWTATKRMNLNLLAALGTPSSANGPSAFPRPAQVAASTTAVLRSRVRVGYRAQSIHELGRRAASGDLDIEAFKHSSLPTLELRKELLKIRGVGPYAAANLLMILGRSDFIPIDTWALTLVSHEWHRGRKITPKHVERAFKRWGEYKGLAFWFWDWKYNGG
jgi:3-methyladenine DNA glycosylase/8-oxoguanine DNA glycosylase